MKNIKIAYLLSFLWRSWFWLGCWVFYYLRFTDYAGIGLLEAIMITTATLGEVPTGAIADIVGKKWAVMLAFALGSIGNLMMALAPSYAVLVLSIVTMTIGGAFYSGSLEALVYDSLKQRGKEKAYNKVIGRINSMQNLGMAIAATTGGYLYMFNVRLPFILVAVFYLIGVFVSWGLEEPSLDTEKYSFAKFLNQNKQGFKQLFPNFAKGYAVLVLLIPGMFMLATENVINDATAVELGFNSAQLGIFATLMYLVGIFVSEKSARIINKFSSQSLYVLLVVLYIITLAVMPMSGFVLGALLLLARYSTQTVYDNYQSIRINSVTESKYRATTLSTYSLLKNIPYALGATAIGALMSLYTAKTFSLYFGLLCLVVVAVIVIVKPALAKFFSN